MSSRLYFFFSSRRRHTRWPRDWSSDMCSSDLSPRDFVERAQTIQRGDHPEPDELGEARQVIGEGIGACLAHEAEIGRASCREREESAVRSVMLEEEIGRLEQLADMYNEDIRQT